MPTLANSWQGRDLGYLRIVAELWGVEFDAPEVRAGIARLAPMLLNRKRVEELMGELPDAARQALNELLENDGQMPWPGFVRRYGDVREMGAGRRDRDRPFESTDTTAAEMLWYRALIARRFSDTPDGPAEFAYIPDEWIDLFPSTPSRQVITYGRPASPGERGKFLTANDSILEDACTLLAALRTGLSTEMAARDLHCGADSPFPLPAAALEILLGEAGLLDEKRIPNPEAARIFLEASRGEALLSMVRAWMNSLLFNELRMLPGVLTEGEWRNDPRRARQAILTFLSTIPGGKAAVGVAGKPWWSLPAFISAIHQHQPDFLRQAGDYESWYLRAEDSGASLMGYEHWEQVEGALVRFMIAGPLHWLGVIDLSAGISEVEHPVTELTAFRLSQWSADLLDQVAPGKMAVESENLVARSDGRIHAPLRTPRAARYQAARFCEWEGLKEGVYRYRISPAGLERARQQGLKIDHLLGLLDRHAKVVPPGLVQALKRWETQGSQARLDHVTVLHLKDPEMLKSLRNSPVKRFLGEPLGPTAVIVKPGAWEKVVSILAEMGYLVDSLNEEED